MPDALDSISLTQGSPEWEALRKRAISDLFWFASFVLGYGERVPIREHMHRAFCRFVERKTGHAALDSARYRKIMMPRETGKSTIVTQARVLQILCQDRERSIMIVNEKEQTARDFLAAIKWQFESNELFRALFPEMIPRDFNDTTWSSSRIVINRESGRKEPSIFVIGVGGTVTGLHPEHIFVDDMISREAAENARAGSWQIMHQVNRWCHQLDMLLNKNREESDITWIGTHWYINDSYDHLEKAFGYEAEKRVYNLRVKLLNGEVQVIPSYRRGDMAVFIRSGIENGRAAFPEIWSMDRMAKSRLRDEVLFAANVQNNPADELTSTFKADWLRYYEWVSETQVSYTEQSGAPRVREVSDFDVMLFVDPGGFAARQVEDRARPAVVCVADDLKGQYLVLDVYNEHDTYLACIDAIAAWCTRYAPRKIVVENAGQQVAFIKLLRNTLAERGIKTVVDEIRTRGVKKPVRILGLEPYFQRGQILVGKGPAFHTFREQYTQFPRTARVDVLDVLAYLPQYARKLGVSMKSQHQRQSEELAGYRARRGLA